MTDRQTDRHTHTHTESVSVSSHNNYCLSRLRATSDKMGLCTEHIKMIRTLFRATCTLTGYSQLNKQYTYVSFIVSLGTAAVTAYTAGCRLPGSAPVQYTYHTIPSVSPATANKQLTPPYFMFVEHRLVLCCEQYFQSSSGSSPLCVITISNIKRCRVGESKHNTLLWCKVSQGRRHVSALYYKAIIRSDMVKTKTNEISFNSLLLVIAYYVYRQYVTS